jgi:hypothetical protein
MGYPGVSINVQTGNISTPARVLDGVAGFLLAGNTSALWGIVHEIYSLQDAESKGFTATAEAYIHKQLEAFYSELGGSQRIFLQSFDPLSTMASMVASTNNAGLKHLINAGRGAITIAGVGTSVSDADSELFISADVSATVLACKPTLQFYQDKNTPLRLIIGANVEDDTVANTYEPNEATNGLCGVALGGITPDGIASVGLVLGRACKYGAHVKLGNGQNGALYVPQIYIGTKPLEERLDAETLHDAGYLTYMVRAGSAGYYFGVDNMASQDDYKILAHGRVIDKAHRLAVAAMLPYVEASVELDTDGTPTDAVCFDIEQRIEQAINAQMGGQISGVKAFVDSTQTGIVSTSTLYAEVSILPLGYLTWIDITIGLSTTI